MSDYPEHDKLALVAEQTQAIGDFLEWATGHLGGARLMRWFEDSDEVVINCEHYNDIYAKRCPRCQGARKYSRTVTHSGWVDPPGGLQDWLARWAGIDRDALEREKRVMLAKLNEQQAGDTR